jgi:DNA repair exonuclease SbcCD nuclease subunit
MSVTCMAIGDPHFQAINVEEIKLYIKKVKAAVIEHSPTFIVILGDLLHTHEKIHETPLNLATLFISGLAKLCPVFLIIGNHDYCNNQQFLTSKHAFNAFKNKPNITICDKVVSATFGDHMFTFLPYVPVERFEEALNTSEHDWKQSKCIFAHQEFYGCKLNPIVESTNGDIWPEDYPQVISGHIHDEQTPQPNIYYPGSSLQHSYLESHDKIIALVKFTKNGKKITRVSLDMPKKTVIYANINECTSALVEKIKSDPTSKTRVCVKGASAQLATFRKTSVFKEMSAVAKVSFNVDKAVLDNNNEPVEKKNVLDILSDLIKNKPNLINVYNELTS